MTKVKVDKNIFYSEITFKPNVCIICIKLYMCKWHEFETIFTSNDVMNIQDGIRNGFGYR